MNTPQSHTTRRLTLAATLPPLLALVILGWSFDRKPASFTPRTRVSPALTAGRYKPISANAAAYAGQSTDAQIYSILSDKCLQPAGESTAQGAAIVQQRCNTRAAQQWTKVSAGKDIFHFVNGLSGLCLDARGPAANRTPVQQWTCNKISNENWLPGDAPADTIPPLFARVSGTRNLCLDIPGGQTAAGVSMQIYRCNGSDAQLWWTP